MDVYYISSHNSSRLFPTFSQGHVLKPHVWMRTMHKWRYNSLIVCVSDLIRSDGSLMIVQYWLHFAQIARVWNQKRHHGKHNRPVSCPVLALITSISRTDRRLTLERLFHILEPCSPTRIRTRSQGKCDKGTNKCVIICKRKGMKSSSILL